MSKQLKRFLAADLSNRLGDDRALVVVQVGGMTVDRANDLRAKLRAEGARMTVIRNRIATKTFDELGMDGLGDVLDGMSAVAHGGGDEGVLSVSRILTDWAKANKKGGLTVLGGYMDGKVLSAADVETLATLPSKDQLLGMIASVVVAPMQSIAAQLNEMIASVARAVDAVREQKESAEG